MRQLFTAVARIIEQQRGALTVGVAAQRDRRADLRNSDGLMLVIRLKAVAKYAGLLKPSRVDISFVVRLSSLSMNLAALSRSSAIYACNGQPDI